MQSYEKNKAYTFDGVQRLVIGFDANGNPVTTTDLAYEEPTHGTAPAPSAIDPLEKARELLAVLPLEKLTMDELAAVAAVLGVTLPADGLKDERTKALLAV